MSIQSEITRIATNISNALSAIANKGVTVPTGSNSDDLAGLIAAVPQLDTSDANAAAADIRSGKSGYVNGSKVNGSVTSRSSSDLSVSGDTVTVPAGIYDTQATMAVASGTAGTPIATKGTVSNHAISITPSVTNTTGYITGSTITGEAVTVAASELDSDSKTITKNGTVDVVGYASVTVSVTKSTTTRTTTSDGTTLNFTVSGQPIFFFLSCPTISTTATNYVVYGYSANGSGFTIRYGGGASSSRYKIASGTGGSSSYSNGTLTITTSSSYPFKSGVHTLYYIY